MSDETMRWLDEALPRNRKGMEECHVFTQLWTEKLIDDPLAVLQTGLALLLDKPFYFIVAPGMALLMPDNLRRLARGILEVDLSTRQGQKQAARWLREQMDRTEKEPG